MKIKFYGELEKLFGKEVTLSLTKHDNIARCIDIVKPGFLKYLFKSLRNGTEFYLYSKDLDKVIGPEDLFSLRNKSVDFLVQPQGSLSGVGGMLQGFATGFAMQWLLNKLNKKKGGKKKYERVVTNSYIYNQNKNLTEQGAAIPLAYGQLRIGTKTISSSIKNYDFDWKTTRIYDQALTDFDVYNFGYLGQLSSNASDIDYLENDRSSFQQTDPTRRIVTIGADGAQTPDAKLGNARPNSSSNDNQNGSDGSQVTEIVSAGQRETAGSRVGFADSSSALIPSKPTPLAKSSESHESSFRPTSSVDPAVRTSNVVVSNGKYNSNNTWTNLTPYNIVGSRGQWSQQGKGKLESISLHRSTDLLCEGPIAGLAMPITGDEYHGQQVYPEPLNGGVTSVSFNRRATAKSLEFDGTAGVNFNNGNTLEILSEGYGYQVGNVYEGGTKSVADMIEVDTPKDSTPASIPAFNGPAMDAYESDDNIYFGSIYHYDKSDGSIRFINGATYSFFSAYASYIQGTTAVRIEDYSNSSLKELETYSVGDNEYNIVKKDFSVGNGYATNVGTVKAIISPVNIPATLGSGISPNGSEIESDLGPSAGLLDTDRRRVRGEAADFSNASHKEIIGALKGQSFSSSSLDLETAFDIANENGGPSPAAPYTANDECDSIGADPDEVARVVFDSYASQITAANLAASIVIPMGNYQNRQFSSSSGGNTNPIITVTFTMTLSQILNIWSSNTLLSQVCSDACFGSYVNHDCGWSNNCKNGFLNDTYGARLSRTGTVRNFIFSNAAFRAVIEARIAALVPNARQDATTGWLFCGVGSGVTYRTAFSAATSAGGFNTFSNLHIVNDGTNPLDFTPNKRGLYRPNTFYRVQVYTLRRYTQTISTQTSIFVHVAPTIIEAVARIDSEGKISSLHLIKVPNNPVIDPKIANWKSDAYRTSDTTAMTPIWPFSSPSTDLYAFCQHENQKPSYITSWFYQDLGVILQVDDSRAPIKSLYFSTELNSADTLNKLNGVADIWDKFAGDYVDFMRRGGTHDPSAQTHSACHYAAGSNQTYKTLSTWQGMGFNDGATIEVDSDLAINSDTEENYDPITATLEVEEITINTSTTDISKTVTAYRRDGLENVIGSSSSATIKTGRIVNFAVNNANNSTDYRYKKSLDKGSYVEAANIKQPSIGINPSSGDTIQKFDLANKGQGYRADFDASGTQRKTRFIVYGRPQSLDTKAKREAAVAEWFGCLTTDDICDEIFAYTFKGIVSINEKGEIDRISVLDAGFGFDDEIGNGLPVTIESLDHIDKTTTSTQLGNHGDWLEDEENNQFINPSTHWNSTKILDTNVSAQAKSSFQVQGVIDTSNGILKMGGITSFGSGFTLKDSFDVDFDEDNSQNLVPAYEAPTFSVTITDNTISSVTITSNGKGYGVNDNSVGIRFPKPTLPSDAGGGGATNPIDSLSWASCVYLDNVPIRDKNGRFNFSKFDLDFKIGNIHNGSTANASRFISYHENAADTADSSFSQISNPEYRVPLQTKDINYPLFGPRNQGEKDYFYSLDIKNRNVSAIILSIKIEKLFYIYEGDSETVYVNFAPALFGSLGFFIGQKLGETLLNEIFSAIMPDVGVTGPGTFSGCISGPTSPQPQIGFSPWNALDVGLKVAKFFVTTAFALAGMALGHILGQKVPCSAAKFLCVKVGNRIENSGEYWPARLEFVIEYFLEGDSDIKRKFVQFNGIATSEYVKDIIIDDLHSPSGDLQNRIVRIFRVTREMDPVMGGEKEARYNMSATLQSATEVIEGVFSYPHTSLISSRTNSKDFSNIPNKEFLLKLKTVKIPSNYSPEVPATSLSDNPDYMDVMYDGNWDGNFKEHLSLGGGSADSVDDEGFHWTNNPAWIIYDIITNKTYGAGKYGINPEHVDKWSFYKFAQRCDELVNVTIDDSSKQEKRHTCNLYIDTEQNSYELVNDLLDNYNADLHWSAGEVFIVQDAPSTEVMLFTNSNVSEDGFSYSTTEAVKRYTACAVDYLDEKDNYRKKTEYVEDFAGIRDLGYSKLSISAAGITRKGEANRLAWHKILTDQTEKEIISFIAGLEAAYLRPGDVVKVMDNRKVSQQSAGRIMSVISDTEIEIDIPASVLSTITHLYIQKAVESKELSNNGTNDSSEINDYRKSQFLEYQISSVSGFKVTLNTSIDSSIKPGYIWMIKSYTSGDEIIEPSLYKVKTITEQENLTFAVNAIEYHPEKYDAVDKSSSSSGENFEARKYTGHEIVV